MSKVLGIVDIQGLFLSCRTEAGPYSRVDFVKLREIFRENETDVIDMVAYPIKSPYHDDTKFIRFLKNQGYIVIRKSSQVIRRILNDGTEVDEFKNNSWTDFMVWEAIQQLPKYDRIVIVSGSGQFCAVANLAKTTGKQVTVAFFKSSLQKELSNLVDKVIILDKKYLFDSSLHKQGTGV